MRWTPAQLGMLMLLGEEPPMGPAVERSLAERIREGRECLVFDSGVDFGYDAARWHEHLRETNAGGYRWSNKHLGMPRRIARAAADPEWRAAVEQLERG